jgi:hypothetical protein
VANECDDRRDDQGDHDPGDEDPEDRMSYVTAVESTAEPDPLPAMGDATTDEKRAKPHHQHPEYDDQPYGYVKPLAGLGRH